MALAADQAGGAWQAGPLYSPLLASGAGGSWAAPVALPQAPGYDALLPVEAGATWLGSKAFQPLPASAAGAQFVHSGPAAQVYQPLAAVSAGASWLGAQPYAALQPGSAGAQWVGQAPNNPSGHVAAGFCATNFGTPARWIAPPAKLVRAAGWQTGSFGTPRSPVTQTGVAEGFCTTRFSHYTYGIVMPGPGPGYHRAAGFRTARFGTPTAIEHRTVVAASLPPSLQFGTPKAALVATAQSVAPAVAFGLPATSLVASAQGFTGTTFGTPHVSSVVKATSTYRPTRFGTPTAIRPDVHVVRPWAPVTRLGHPRRYVERWHFATSFSDTRFGTPSVELRYRVTMMPPATRFGTPLLIRNTPC